MVLNIVMVISLFPWASVHADALSAPLQRHYVCVVSILRVICGRKANIITVHPSIEPSEFVRWWGCFSSTPGCESRLRCNLSMLNAYHRHRGSYWPFESVITPCRSHGKGTRGSLELGSCTMRSRFYCRVAFFTFVPQFPPAV